VTVWSFGRFNGIGTYFVSVLHDLGFAADARQFDSPDAFFREVFDPVRGPNVQASVSAWFPDFPSASDMFAPSFRCGDPANFGHFCDDAVATRIAAAQSVQLSDPAAAGQAWAAIDRAIVDLAPAAPFANQRRAEVVSARVGNYQHNPQWTILYDQLWVQ
jgi:ABC-type transport system substrate-binding protein